MGMAERLIYGLMCAFLLHAERDWRLLQKRKDKMMGMKSTHAVVIQKKHNFI
jgi:hypothetical protein